MNRGHQEGGGVRHTDAGDTEVIAHRIQKALSEKAREHVNFLLQEDVRKYVVKPSSDICISTYDRPASTEASLSQVTHSPQRQLS